MKIPCCLAACAVLAACAASAEEASPLLRSGDRVVLIGNTVIERARLNGHLETALQVAAGPKVTGLSFRNLGWSGDSVLGDARSYFGPPKEGRERLGRNLAELQPDVVLLCYGTGAAMSVDHGWTEEREAATRSAGGLEESLALFREGYQALIDLVRSASGSDLREIVLVSPPPLENLGDPLPDQAENNRRLARFRNAVRELAETNDLPFVDWFGALGGDEFSVAVASPALTSNGIHYTDDGYLILARELAHGLGYPETTGPMWNEKAVDELRDAIVEKDRLFFHRWRPANETYLFLFRKHEQGQNAREIPMFDPLIAEQEARIEEARKRVFQGPVKE